MLSREDLVQVFWDTMELCKLDAGLSGAVRASVKGTRLYKEDEEIELPQPAAGPLTVMVSKERSFEAARRMLALCPGERVAVHNFASATNPGGGVKNGSRAQEEALCRISTLYPVLATKANFRDYYDYHRARHDVRYTDRVIYTPGIVVLKSDTDAPVTLPEEERCQVDVITCAAPNLRRRLYNEANRGAAAQLSETELFNMHVQRARQMLRAAAANGAKVLVLGAFGCGAFANDPKVVAQAYAKVLPEFAGYFRHVNFAVYCPPGSTTQNYEVFARVLS